MTVSSGFFDSVNHDRLYNADQVSSMFDGLILDGVYENMCESFAINAYPDAENTVIVGTGRAWFDHTWTLNDTQYALTLDPPSDSMSRIDAIVLDVDKTLEVRNNTIKLIKGTPVFTGETAQKPILIKEDLHNQYPLAYVTRSAGASATINQADIEYMVGTDECPMVIGLLEAINIEQVYAQLKDEFYLWWDGVILGDPDMATHLQEQIDALEKDIENLQNNQITFDVVKSAVPHFAIYPYNMVYSVEPYILPDGYILMLFRGNTEDFPSSEAPTNYLYGNEYDNYGSVNCCLYSLDGVYSNYTNIYTVNDNGGRNNQTNEYPWYSNITKFSEQTETYPAKIRFLLKTGVECSGIETSGNKTGSRAKVTKIEYTFYVVTVTEDHVISVDSTVLDATPYAYTNEHYKYLDYSSGFGSDGTMISPLPAYCPNGNEISVDFSSWSNSRNDRGDNSSFTVFNVTKNNVISIVERNSSNSLYGYGNNHFGGVASGTAYKTTDGVYLHYSLSENLIYALPNGHPTNSGAAWCSVYIFTSDGHINRAIDTMSNEVYPDDDKGLREKLHLGKTSIKYTDFNFISNGYKYYQDPNSPNTFIKEPYDYSSISLIQGDSPIYPLITDNILDSGSGEEDSDSEQYSGLTSYTERSIASTAKVSCLIESPDNDLLISSVVDGSYSGIKILITDGGSRGVFSKIYGYVGADIGSEVFGPTTVFPTFADYEVGLGSTVKKAYGMLGLKRNFWKSSDGNTYLMIVYGGVTTNNENSNRIIVNSVRDQSGANFSIWRIDR